MSYNQGLISGLILSVVIALISPLVQWVTIYVISPKYFPNVIKRSVEMGYFETTKVAKANFNYTNYVLQGIIVAFFMVVVSTAIAMIFIPTKTYNLVIKNNNCQWFQNKKSFYLGRDLCRRNE